jgi:two-component system CheB/CheR fusion protein
MPRKRPTPANPENPAPEPQTVAEPEAVEASPVDETPEAAPEPQAPDAPATVESSLDAEAARAGRSGRLGAPDHPIVAIGASAGGLDAFRRLLRMLPVDTGMSFVLIQHLDPSHHSLLSELLGREAKLPVTQAEDGMRAEPDHVYVIPPDKDLEVFHGVLQLVPRQHEHGIHLPIDHFFRSLAQDTGDAAIAVVLSGTGSDGVRGMREIRAVGGMTFAQEPKSAEYDGMPKSVINADLVDMVATPEKIAEELARIAKHPFLRSTLTNRAAAIEDRLVPERDDLSKLFLILRDASGVDFSHYKPATVRRRIDRRLLLHRVDDIASYLELLRTDSDEVNALYRDMLISVTEFFRDGEAFDAVRKTVFPKLLEGREYGKPIRIWVPGCSTGEEVYSILMSLIEYLDQYRDRPPITIFGTDINDEAVSRARNGIYPGSIRADVSPERLSRFFTPLEEGYQIRKFIREMCVFSRQDIAQDPPFSRMDMVSLRNVLIYMDQELQRRIMSILHYALVPGGYLVLGQSETVGSSNNLFATIDRTHRIYRRRDVNPRLPKDFPKRERSGLYQPGVAQPADNPPGIPPRFSVQREADDIALSRYTPPRVVVDSGGTIVHFFGDTNPYLEHPSGRASLNVLDMARDGLSVDIKEILQILEGTDDRYAARETFVRFEDGYRPVAVEGTMIVSPSGDPYTLIVFRELPPPPVIMGEDLTAAGEEAMRREEQLRREITAMRKHLQTVVEEKDDTNEELRAANEEIQSSNEELQSINEELETAKEELQSTNEELTTINDELTRRNAELAEVNDDLSNFLSSVDIPVLMLDAEHALRRYTPQASRIADVSVADIGRHVSRLHLQVPVPDLEELANQAFTQLDVVAQEVRGADGNWWSVQVRPYMTSDNKIEGVVVRFIDIDQLKRSLDDAERRAELTLALSEIDMAVASTRETDEIMARVVRLASEAIGSETAAIALKSPDGFEMRYVFGLPADLVGSVLPADENPHAALAVSDRMPVLISDAASDERMNQGMVEKYQIRSSLVVPLMVRDEPLGVIFFNYHSHTVAFDSIDQDFAMRLASTVSLGLENARLYQRERHIAEVLQEAILAAPDTLPGIEVAYLYCPASEASNVGGDFYDLFDLPDGRIAIVLGDVSGKGLHAAQLTTLTRGVLRAFALETGSPADALARANNVLAVSSPPESFATVFLAYVDTEKGQVTYCGAGHPGALLLAEDGNASILRSQGPILGAVPGRFAAPESTAAFGPEDTLVLYTDGLTEARRGRRMFGEERLYAALRGMEKVGIEQVPTVLLDAVLSFTDGELADDAVVMAVRRGEGRTVRVGCTDHERRPDSRPARSGGFEWSGGGDASGLA